MNVIHFIGIHLLPGFTINKYIYKKEETWETVFTKLLNW